MERLSQAIIDQDPGYYDWRTNFGLFMPDTKTIYVNYRLLYERFKENPTEYEAQIAATIFHELQHFENSTRHQNSLFDVNTLVDETTAYQMEAELLHNVRPPATRAFIARVRRWMEGVPPSDNPSAVTETPEVAPA
jgi:hypothetical protein